MGSIYNSGWWGGVIYRPEFLNIRESEETLEAYYYYCDNLIKMRFRVPSREFKDGPKLWFTNWAWSQIVQELVSEAVAKGLKVEIKSRKEPCQEEISRKDTFQVELYARNRRKR